MNKNTTRPKYLRGSVFPPNPLTQWSDYKSRESIIIFITAVLTYILNIISLLPIIDWLMTDKLKIKKLWIREVFVLIVLSVPIYILCFGNPNNPLSLIIAHICLLNVLSATLRDIFVSPMWHRDEEGGYIYIRSRLRWLLVVPIHACVIVTSFALIYYYYGDQFTPQIEDTITALYMSALTFTTLGYGDIKPICALGKEVVIYELFYFFLFIGIKLPIAISVIRVKRIPTA